MKRNSFLILILFFTLTAFRADRPVITVFMIGDSTMADKSLQGQNPERGWGHVLPGFFTEEIRVDNHAQNGRSSKSFIDEGRWENVISQVKKGDYVFIQFGHNDEKPDEARHTVPGGSFEDNLRRFVRETREKEGIPVLFNSIVRRNFVANENAVLEDDMQIEATGSDTEEGLTLIDTHGAYLDAPRRVAEELGVAFIDMNRITHELVEGMGPEESKKLFVWVEPNTIPLYPKGKEDNTHLNVYGARRIARLAVEAIAEAVPELGQYVQYYDYVVAQDGSGDFFTVQEAINAVPDFRKNIRTRILIRRGSYKEKIVIPESKINVSLIGEKGVVLTYDDYANKKNVFGEPMGTSGSASCYIYGPDFYAENITFENSAGPVGQAVACFVCGDRAYFRNCRFLGFQDTLYNYGKESRQYYEDCYVEGTVDFIFGWSTVVFNRCTIHSKRNGFVAAPATDPGKPYGYVFYECKLAADPGVENVYLARPWRTYGQAVYIRCELGAHIASAGWDPWAVKDPAKTTFLAEYENFGPGAGTAGRAAYSHQLKDLKGYSIEEVLAGKDGWNPVKNGNELVEVYR
ncbi:MAG: pectinesterase family protein [Bacteroides sp.]|nr:pectinesterase family protein [Bacteroides sp.]